MNDKQYKRFLKIYKEEKKARQRAQIITLARDVVRSPLFQIVGGITLTEAAKQAGILSNAWAGGIEGSIITMTALSALKDYGVIGAGSLGFGFGAGAVAQSLGDIFSTEGALDNPFSTKGGLLDVLGITD